jgi:hypothetical protein
MQQAGVRKMWFPLNMFVGKRCPAAQNLDLMSGAKERLEDHSTKEEFQLGQTCPSNSVACMIRRAQER